MKTIKQIAEEIGVTKQAVFYRIKRPPLSNTLQSLTQNIDGVLMVSFDGEMLIKQAFFDNTAKGFDDKEPSKENTSFDGEIIQILRENIIVLQEQLAVKDKQIGELTSALVFAQRTADTAQALHAGTIRQHLPPETSPSPQHSSINDFTDLDDDLLKMEIITEEYAEEKPPEKGEKRRSILGWLQRIVKA